MFQDAPLTTILTWTLSTCFAASAGAAPTLEEANELIQSTRYAEAIAAYDAILAESKDPALRGKAIYNLGTAYQAAGDHERAITTFQRMFDEAVDDREPGGHIMETYRNYRARAMWEIGNSCFALGRYAEALDAYQTTQQKFPFQSWCGNAHAEYAYRYAYQSAVCLEYLGRHADAVRAYFEATGARVRPPRKQRGGRSAYRAL